MMVRINAVLVLALLLNTISFAQVFPAKNYPREYFTWPVDAKKALVANFGELRPNHYHMGLDCRTDQLENKRVLAAADGYIAKVKIEPIGFGRCIYINHPNGLTTLYAHLNNFNPALEQYITEKQYKLQSWKVFLDIPAGLFPVKKGEFFAYSGNTGGSQGPHVHFEIRDTKTDKVLNPLLFGFPIADNTAPDILRLAVYDRGISSFEQIPKFYPLKKVNGSYTTGSQLILTQTDKVSFAITAYDRYTGSTNKNGIYQAVLYDNEQPVSGFQLDSIGYDETRYLNAHIDYKLRNSGGSYVQHLSRLAGYPQGVYKDISGDGVITIEDDSVHQIKIEVKDAEGNTSRLHFGVQRLLAKQPRPPVNPIAIYQPGEFHPGFINVYENSNISFYLPENALYDSIRFKYSEIIPLQGYPIYRLHNGNIPVHCMFPVKIKAENRAHPDKMVMHRFWSDKNDYAKAFPVAMGNEKGWYQASFRAFGNFQLLEDTTPPSITPIGIRDGMNAGKLNRIAFVIKDNTKELQNFTAFLDGKWLRFTNDKGSAFIYKFDEYCPPGEHELKISVEDCVGNRAERIYHFTR
ncbi:MAG: M23 family metallopeptidase [Ferruginibacter sp.]|nr:M23 family metallopeptidase [Ferruginibacter sp.]